MPGPTYIRLRADTGTYAFRWVVAADIRSLLGGRREVTKTLHTEDKRLARRLAAVLDRFTFELEVMAKKKSEQPGAALILKLIERQLTDGTTERERIYQTSDDPAERRRTGKRC